MTAETKPGREPEAMSDHELVARENGWHPKRNDGSLNAGVVNYSGRGPGFRWVMSWQDACMLSGLSNAQVSDAAKRLREAEVLLIEDLIYEASGH